MADTYVVSASKRQVWDADFVEEYVRASQFSDMMGSSKNLPIYIDRSLMREKGNTKNVPLRAKLTGPGVSGNTTLEGQEETLDNYSDPVTIEWRRHGVLIPKPEEKSTELDLRDGGKMALKDWFLELDRDQIIETLQSTSTDGLTAYADASTAVKDAWNVANSDRVFYGASSSNYDATHATALANIDNTADKLTYTNARAARSALKQASPLIRPIRVDGRGEFFVAYAPSYCMRDLRISLETIHQNGRERGVGNPLFQDGDILFENIIFKEVEEMPVISGVGAGSIDVAQVAYCGAQAVLGCYKQMPQIRLDTRRDYEFRYGVAIEGARRFKKAFFNSKQHSVFTHFVAAVAS